MIIIINTMIRIGIAISKNDAQISPSVSIMLSSNALIINDYAQNSKHILSNFEIL